ncbi:craniofacial development protein 2-like [Amphiura filiformis]|uniref:craniofacial development protein 2-like n=1 Tax=Amphiura filiformis TaxID=82378 RepID=UPI003B21F890
MTAGKLEIVTKRMGEQHICVLGISETWWLNQRRFTTDNGYTVIYSGKDEGKREFGVGFILDRNTARSFLGFNPINDRIISLRLHGHPFNISIVQVYAPTSTASDEAMENFYGQLQDVLDKIPSKDMLINLGDWNAKVGKSDIKSRSIGKFGLGERNDRGDSLEEFCQANDLIVGNTLFQQHPRRLRTWRSPGGNVKNQIDYTSRGDSEWFQIGRGVRQGCILSPQLFNIYAESIMRGVLEDFRGGVTIGGQRITNLRYADDTTLVCSSNF